MSRSWALMFSVLLFVPRSFSQQFSEAIEDNSCFIEEAFNQEIGVVQHIFTGFFQRETKDFLYAFTQEWPAGGQRHQLSYTISYQSFKASSGGIGDSYINYRYQLWDHQDWAWVAPRLSLILPTGNSARGLGNGVLGVQLNVPVSKRWTDEFVSHFNVGFTVLPNVEGTTAAGKSVNRTLLSYSVGTSGIWLLAERFNLMCETLFTINSDIDDAGNVSYSGQTILSLGFRCALNLDKLQIVPGLAFPITFVPGGVEEGVFAYLSFEHPF